MKHFLIKLDLWDWESLVGLILAYIVLVTFWWLSGMTVVVLIGMILALPFIVVAVKIGESLSDIIGRNDNGSR